MEQAIMNQDGDPVAEALMDPNHSWAVLPETCKERGHARTGEEHLFKDKQPGNGAKGIRDVRSHEDIVRERVSETLRSSEETVSTRWETQSKLFRGELVNEAWLVEVKGRPSGQFEAALEEQNGPHSAFRLVERSTPSLCEEG